MRHVLNILCRVLGIFQLSAVWILLEVSWNGEIPEGGHDRAVLLEVAWGKMWLTSGVQDE